MAKVLLEICCGSIDDAIQASEGGADRVELCSALFLGGLTPSLGAIQEARKRLRIPIIAMVRPRSGGFCYTDAEFASMERDVRAALDHGADGIVFGILTPDGQVDVPRNTRMRELIGDRQAVFHRAFDVVPNPKQTLETLISLGITRVLTSGQEPSVLEGARLIKELIQQAGNRIEVLPGGGMRPDQVPEVIERTGCSQVHLTAFKTVHDASTEARSIITFGGALTPPENLFQMTDREQVGILAASLKK